MKIKSLIGLVCMFALIFSACDDDLRSIGGNIQPGGDDIYLRADTFPFHARTVSLKDSIYAKTIYGLLGKYNDDFFGTIKSEYLGEFYCSENTSFDKNFYRIDSTRLSISFASYAGDSLAPMGVAIYAVNKPLEKDYYTNLDISKFYDATKKPLGTAAYTIKGLPFTPATSKQRIIYADLGDLGQRIYDASLTSENPLKGTDEFRKFFPGVYVNSSFGGGALVEVGGTTLGIFYTTKRDTVVKDVTTGLPKDSVMYAQKTMYFSVTPEVVQLNKVQNETPSSLLEENTGAVYLKSPAGLHAELDLPIASIIDSISKKKEAVNMARLVISGYTEKETTAKYELGRPKYLLLINKDSVAGFFTGVRRADKITTFLAQRSTSNTYDFSNISALIEKYKKDGVTKDPKFVLLPVDAYASGQEVILSQSMRPSTSILRADKNHMRIELVLSKYD